MALQIISEEDYKKFQEYLDKITKVFVGPTEDHDFQRCCPICNAGGIEATRFGTSFAVANMLQAECSNCGYVMLFNKRRVFSEKFKKE